MSCVDSLIHVTGKKYENIIMILTKKLFLIVDRSFQV